MKAKKSMSTFIRPGSTCMWCKWRPVPCNELSQNCGKPAPRAVADLYKWVRSLGSFGYARIDIPETCE